MSPGAALVIGLGVSGAAAAEALHAHGWRVRAAEQARTPAVDERVAALVDLGVDVERTAREPRELLDGVDLVVPSPGVPPHAPVLAATSARDVEVISEPELAWRLADGRTRLVAVTGTNGKTTTTELLAACLGAPAAGNIGLPLSRLLGAGADGPPPPPLVVAELSSFQLEFTSSLAPDVATVLNLAPDHLDWHGSFVAYAAAKARIWRAQAGAQVAIVNGDDAEAAGLLHAHPPPARVATFPADDGAHVADGCLWWRDTRVVAVEDLAASRPHDLANALAAVTTAVSAGAEPCALAGPLRSYRPGRHRLERVATVAGVDYINDSKATNPHAAAAALVAHPSGDPSQGHPGQVVWIAGGLNKGLGFDGLAPLLPGRVRAAVTIGSSGPALAAVARSAGVPVIEAGTLEVAVPTAAGLARAGDTVLLAPACASMDQFANYAARGEAFRHAVAALTAEGQG